MKLTSATEQNKEADFDLVDGGFVPKASAANLLTPVSSQTISALNDVPQDVLKAGGTGGIPYRGSAVLLAYDTKTVATPPKTLDDLLAWIKANPGKFTYNSPKSGGSGGAFVATVLDKFVPADARAKMTVGYEKDLEKYWDQGFATLKDLNSSVFQNGVYPNGNQQTLDLLAKGQISMAPVWSDQFITGLTNGQIPSTVRATQISNPSFTGGAAYLGIPKSSPHQEAALKLANFVLSPDAQTMIIKDMSGFPAISLDKLPADVKDKFKDADTNNLRKGYFDQMGKDLNNLWDQKVPGQ
ncbi:extracellular solute-binding protein [Arthrobacter bambusae]|uniref:extracellular solute-binding protein n=1 Tax=Arthrobacter bambusae TaxID=1338426 RepID=UPI00278AE4A6|nr:extracellular solute-binding protein [Arthrobacter bambusae]MDQ0029408.1 putative spermidine/putrescine transport system substrate-binding protein [Arthrobacter bambusae]MDQ0097068.1 putative spermidine/putrescine transport system substrate-binding protein [Arthrobacter bambusae]